MRRLVDRPRTGGRRSGRQNHRRRSTGEDCGNGGKLYRTIFAFTVAMSLSRNLRRGISIAAISLAVTANGQIQKEMPEAARPAEEGVAEVGAYQVQKLLAGLRGRGRPKTPMKP